MQNDPTRSTPETLIAARWEPCAAFCADSPGSAVCAECGWLADDHRVGAVVHRLPRHPAASVKPRRLAS